MSKFGDQIGERRSAEREHRCEYELERPAAEFTADWRGGRANALMRRRRALLAFVSALGAVRERLFACARCPAAFARRPYLVTHMRTHTGERPYQCDACLKRFTQKSSLNIHKRTHTGGSLPRAARRSPLHRSHCRILNSTVSPQTLFFINTYIRHSSFCIMSSVCVREYRDRIARESARWLRAGSEAHERDSERSRRRAATGAPRSSPRGASRAPPPL
ncbi:hypothetical protein EVAR_13363_1 [Eumeta japonica]|uniref:C2H2-type domain-containing protein n=1 Tax=Eumeta variegata TaxID=151549 RepID=A0A4C1TS30_EUMVA|nr:hypothetical protein EVAR_13363_1 [Eumeta japonica]